MFAYSADFARTSPLSTETPCAASVGTTEAWGTRAELSLCLLLKTLYGCGGRLEGGRVEAMWPWLDGPDDPAFGAFDTEAA